MQYKYLLKIQNFVIHLYYVFISRVWFARKLVFTHTHNYIKTCGIIFSRICKNTLNKFCVCTRR